MAIRTIKSLRKKYTSAKVLVIVPTDLLKNQWKEELFKNGVPDVDVQVMNGASKREYTCDLLIIDKHLSM